jgi:hypothetical protein
VRAKPRGSIIGLKKNREDLKARNTEAMMGVIAQLRIEKPASKWWYKEVWSRAGLKSQIALDSPWNAHVRAEIETHNARILCLAPEVIFGPRGLVYDKDLLKSLKDELRICKEQRDKALSRIAQFAADTDYIKRKCDDLTKTVERLRGKRVGALH